MINVTRVIPPQKELLHCMNAWEVVISPNSYPTLLADPGLTNKADARTVYTAYNSFGVRSLAVRTLSGFPRLAGSDSP